MACECDGFARRSSKPLDKVRFLGELLSVNGAVRGIGIATELKPQCLWVRIPPTPLVHDVVRELVQRRSLNLRDCGFESRLRHLIVKWVDWTWESMPSVKRSLVDEQCRFDSFSAH